MTVRGVRGVAFYSARNDRVRENKPLPYITTKIIRLRWFMNVLKRNRMLAGVLALSMMTCTTFSACDSLNDIFPNGNASESYSESDTSNDTTESGNGSGDSTDDEMNSAEESGSNFDSSDDSIGDGNDDTTDDSADDSTGGDSTGDDASSGEDNGDEEDDTVDDVLPEPPHECTSDPYVGMSATVFYKYYSVACCNKNAAYRTQHGFMSGELTVPDQTPTLAATQPKNGNYYVRNSEMLLSEDGNTYTVVDCYGNPVFNVYRDGAYITLEEVAAYVYAFGTYPKNHSTSKSTKPTQSVWGEYLRVNHTMFSGDTSRYPYEPKLPNITGCGGSLQYWEMDIGTTGNDCDPAYTPALYNNGSSITRGAARIVYGKNDLNNNGVYEIGEFHVFYTYNHYNDFQEYLNYQGGWGQMFGNITGGGTISSKYDYNPTPYVNVVLQPLK